MCFAWRPGPISYARLQVVAYHPGLLPVGIILANYQNDLAPLKLVAALNTSVTQLHNFSEEALFGCRPCGLDHLSLLVPVNAKFTRLFGEVQRALKLESYCQDFRCRWPVFVEFFPQRNNRSTARAKIRFSELSLLSLTDIVSSLNEMLEIDPLTLKVSRLDLSADWFTHKLPDFRAAVTVISKRSYDEVCNPNTHFTKVRYAGGRPETLYYGAMKSNDVLRIYDKVAEQRDRKGRANFPALPWVRIERMLKGDRIPGELARLGGLIEHGGSFDPFAALRIADVPSGMTTDFFRWAATLNERKNVVHVAWLIEAEGRQQTKRRLKDAGRNVREDLARFDRAVSEMGAAPTMPSPAQLTSKFQEAFRTQLDLWEAHDSITTQTEG